MSLYRYICCTVYLTNGQCRLQSMLRRMYSVTTSSMGSLHNNRDHQHNS